MTTPELDTVRDWHEALNQGDADRLVRLSDPEVRVGGPRGSGAGSGLLREWVSRANVDLEPQRVFHRGETVVVEEAARWRSPDSGEVTGSATVATVFVVRDGLVSSVARHDDLAQALDAADLDESSEARAT